MDVVFYVAWALAVASAASTAVVSEREEDTWTSLTSTPLGGEEILRAKMFGAVWGTRWLGFLLLAFWLLGVASGAVHPFGLAAVAVETAVFLWFAAALGVSMSVGAKTSARAQSATMLILLLINGVYLACCLPSSGFDSILVAAGVTPMIEGLSLLSYQDVWRLFRSVHGRDFEAAMTCVVGVVVYGAAALALTTRAFATFDARIDRPQRNWERPMIAKKDLEILEVEGDVP
jgi:ABC-type transport system involved in multi-copper enzyme maturation permease subunit